MANAHRDDNRETTLLAASNAGTGVPIELWADPTTHRLLVTATLSGGSSIPVSGATTATVVAIVDGSGNQVTSFGGGTQYTEGDTDASITGTALMFEGAANALVAAPGTAANGLDVDVTRVSGTVTVDGSGVTQPVSAASLPLPTGASTAANQSTANTSLATIAGAVSGNEVRVQATDLDIRDLNSASDSVTADTELTTADLDTGAGTATRAVVGLLSAESGGPTLVGSANGLPVNLVADAMGLAQESGGNLENIASNTSNLAVESGGNLDAVAASLATLDNIVSGSEAQVDVVTVPTDPFGANTDAASATGSISAKLRFIAATGIPITGTVTVGSHAVTNAGTFAVQDATAQASLSVMDDWDNGASDGASVSGDVAHDTTDAGEPVKIGMKAVALKANPTEVAAGDRTNWYADVSGVPFVLGGHPNILTQALQVTDADGAQTDTAIITAGANVAIVVTKVSVMVDSATTNVGGVSVRIGFGTANTPAVDAAQTLLFHPGIAAGSGVVEGTGAGIIGIGASNEDVRVTCEDPASGSISIIVTYFTTDI